MLILIQIMMLQIETQKQELIVQLVLIDEAAKGAYSTERGEGEIASRYRPEIDLFFLLITKVYPKR